MLRYRLLIIDFDGTLVSTRPAITYCMRLLFDRVGCPCPTDDEISATIGLPLEEAFIKLAGNAARRNTGSWVALYRELHEMHADEQCHAFEGVRETLEKLSAAGAQVAVVSNKGAAAVQRALRRLELSDYVAGTFAERPGMPTKPDAALYRNVILSFPNTSVANTIVVGDTVSDLLFARNAGTASCWAAYGYGKHAECIELRPTHTIGSFPELYAVVVT